MLSQNSNLAYSTQMGFPWAVMREIASRATKIGDVVNEAQKKLVELLATMTR